MTSLYTCPKCLHARPRDARFFRPRVSAPDGFRRECALCTLGLIKRWAERTRRRYRGRVVKWLARESPQGAENRRKRHRNGWNYHLGKYGITVEDYERLLLAQAGRCAICARAPDPAERGNRTLHLDHDHKTGTIRDLLCFRCNNGLGLFRDNSELLRTAAAYLRAAA